VTAEWRFTLCRDSGVAIHTVVGAELLAASAHVASISRATCPRIGPEDVCLIVVYPEETLGGHVCRCMTPTTQADKAQA
jgi:hypothetical protein